MSTVMKLCGTAAGGRTPYDGQYLRDFDFNAADGQGLASMTPHLDLAKRFPDLRSAMEYRLLSPASKPLRSDGQPNRPLTATNWEFQNAD